MLRNLPVAIRATFAARETAHASKALVVSSTVRRYLSTIGRIACATSASRIISRNWIRCICCQLCSVGAKGRGPHISNSRFGFVVARTESYLPERAADFEQVLEFRQRPDEPLGRVELPWLHSVTVVMLKFVVVVVIAFAHGEKGEEERVARAAPG